MNSVDEPVNRLTSSHTDKATHTPAYKETSVQLRVLGEIGEPAAAHQLPLRTSHAAKWSRSERKWKRKDYANLAISWFRSRPARIID